MYLEELKMKNTMNKAALKVKMFIHNTVDTVENEVNQWIAANDIEPCHITQSQSEKQGRFVFVMSVFFREK
jgi:hypothetical protein